MSDPVSLAQNIIKNHGLDGFRLLVNLLKTKESGTKIGAVFGVSRQRVCQWRKALGTQEFTFSLRPEVEDLVTFNVSKSVQNT